MNEGLKTIVLDFGPIKLEVATNPAGVVGGVIQCAFYELKVEELHIIIHLPLQHPHKDFLFFNGPYKIESFPYTTDSCPIIFFTKKIGEPKRLRSWSISSKRIHWKWWCW